MGRRNAFPQDAHCRLAFKNPANMEADYTASQQVGELTRGEVAALRWARSEGVALVEDVVSFLQPYSDRIILDAKTRDVVREGRERAQAADTALELAVLGFRV